MLSATPPITGYRWFAADSTTHQTRASLTNYPRDVLLVTAETGVLPVCERQVLPSNPVRASC